MRTASFCSEMDKILATLAKIIHTRINKTNLCDMSEIALDSPMIIHTAIKA